MQNRHLLATLAIAVVPVVLAACWVEPDPATNVSPAATNTQPDPQPTTTVPSQCAMDAASDPEVSQDIETGQTIASDPGEGRGIYVEYRGEGVWVVWATCDTNVSELPCNYGLSLQPKGGATIVDVVDAFNEESPDRTNSFEFNENQAAIDFTTTYESDGVKVTVDDPEAPLLISVTLDCEADPRLVYWIGPDVLHYGAPSIPVEFVPVTSN